MPCCRRGPRRCRPFWSPHGRRTRRWRLHRTRRKRRSHWDIEALRHRRIGAAGNQDEFHDLEPEATRRMLVWDSDIVVTARCRPKMLRHDLFCKLGRRSRCDVSPHMHNSQLEFHWFEVRSHRRRVPDEDLERLKTRTVGQKHALLFAIRVKVDERAKRANMRRHSHRTAMSRTTP